MEQFVTSRFVEIASKIEQFLFYELRIHSLHDRDWSNGVMKAFLMQKKIQSAGID